jgi:hypothetical protein
MSGLEAFVAAVERAHAEHRVSFVAAGDEKIYAYGGDGYVVVFNERVFGDLVELETPCGSARIEPNKDGSLAVTSTPPDVDADELLSEAARGLLRYYEKRYW